MNIPFISFIIPVYNREQSVTKAVDSILQSSFEDCEILLINDASTDRTGAVCDRLSERYKTIFVIHHSVNQGPGASRNDGLKVARGKYVYFLDSDDLIVSSALPAIAERLKKDNVDILTANHRTVTPNGEQAFYNFTEEVVLDGNELLRKKPSVLHTELWRHVFRTQFVRERGIQIPNVFIGEDTCFSCLSFLQARSVATFPRVFCIHRRMEKNSLVESSDWHRYLEGFEKCASIISRFCLDYSLTEEAIRAADAYIYSCVIPLLKSIPLEAFHTDNEFYAEPKEYCVDLELYRNKGIFGCAEFVWSAVYNRIRSEINGKMSDVYLCPAGGVSSALSSKLNSCGISVAGILDNKLSKENFYLSETNSVRIYSFDKLKEYSDTDKDILVIVLGSSSTAAELSEQLKAFRYENGKQFLCFLNAR